MTNPTPDERPWDARPRSQWPGYVAAVAAAVVASLVRLALDPVLGDHYPFATYFGAVAVVAWYGHTRSSVVALVLSGVLALYLFLPPRYSLAAGEPGVVLGLALFLAVGVVMVGMGHATRLARGRAERLFAEVVVRRDELQRAAEDRAEQAERLRTTLASIGDAVISTDAGGTVTYMNPVAEGMTGWAQADARGKPFAAVFDIINEHTRLPVENPVEKVLALGRVVGVANHTILVRRNGTELHIDDSAAPIRDERGRVVGAVVVFHDITGRRHAEAERERAVRAVREGEERLRLALTAARMVAWEWTPADRKLRVSENAAEVFGLPAGVGLTGIDQGLALVHPDDVAAYRATFQKAIDDRGSYLTLYRLVRPDDGRVIWIEERGHAVFDQPGGGVRLFGVAADVTDRERAGEAVREARSRLESTLAAGEVGTWEFDVVSNTVRADPNLARMFGVTPGAAAGGRIESYTAAIHPDDRQRVSEVIGRAVHAGERYEVDYRLVAPDGSIRWVVARGRVERDGAGRAVRLPGVVVDVTARRRAEADLRASEERRRLALDAAELGAWNIDPATATLTSDERFRVIFQGSPAPLTYEQAFARVHPDDRQRVRDGVAAATRPDDPAPYAEEYRVVHPDGTTRWVFAKGRANFVTTGAGRRLSSFDGTVSDVTDRKRMQDALRASEEKFRTLFDSMDEGYCVIEMMFDAAGRPADYRFLEVNPAFEKHNGLRDAAGRTMRDFAPDMDEFWFETYGRVARTGEPSRFVKESKALNRWFDVYAFRLGGEGSNKVAVLFTDITERTRAEMDLRRLAADLSDAHRRKDEFLATLAHELRNPLAPLRNGLQVIRLAGASGPVEQARSMMDRQLTQLVRLVDDLLDVSRVTSGKLELRRERVALGAVIDAAVETSRPAVEQAGHALAVAVPDEPIFVDGDVTRLAQVVANLLTNSAKYTHPGGHIWLTVAREDGGAAVSVRDDGIGIPPAMLGRVFDMFTQVDRTLEKTTGGLGIGLSLVKGLVEMHGGTIEARSEGEGRGSEFVVRLPVVAPAGGVASKGDEPDGAVPPVRRRVLVVDDNVDAADSLAQLLEMLGNEVRTANDGEAGVGAAAAFRPAVVLMDIGMPKLNGYEAARRIREHPWGRNMVLVALTGWGQDDDRKKSSDAGFDHHLVKPVEFAALTKLLTGVATA